MLTVVPSEAFDVSEYGIFATVTLFFMYLLEVGRTCVAAAFGVTLYDPT